MVDTPMAHASPRKCSGARGVPDLGPGVIRTYFLLTSVSPIIKFCVQVVRPRAKKSFSHDSPRPEESSSVAHCSDPSIHRSTQTLRCFAEARQAAQFQFFPRVSFAMVANCMNDVPSYIFPIFASLYSFSAG